MNLRLGTRGSELARTQSLGIAARLEDAGHTVELTVIRTAGDDSTAPSFGSIGAQGVFVREIEQALVDGRIDLAVHSFKDLPTRSPDGLVIAAVPPRVDPADLLITRAGSTATDGGDVVPLGPGIRVGTSSARRQAWLNHFRPDLVVAPLRGNVPTRIERLREGRYDAILLAAAGIERLGGTGGVLRDALADLTVTRLAPERFVPAPAQGALAVQCRAADPALRDVLAALDDAPTRTAVELERAVLARAEGGCDTAFGAHCTVSAASITLVAMLERGGRVLTAHAAGPNAAELADWAWAELAANGAA